jgi:hypothetical protein
MKKNTVTYVVMFVGAVVACLGFARSAMTNPPAVSDRFVALGVVILSVGLIAGIVYALCRSDAPVKPGRTRWKTHDKWVALALALCAMYMGTYYATVAHYCGEPDGKYMIGDAELPAWIAFFFAPADWAEHWLQLGPCRREAIIDPPRTW